VEIKGVGKWQGRRAEGGAEFSQRCCQTKMQPLEQFFIHDLFPFSAIPLFFFFAQFSFVKRVWGPNAPRIFHAPMHAILRGHMKIITKKIETKIETSTGILIPQEINH